RTHDLVLAAARAFGRVVQSDLRQAEPRAAELAVVTGRLLGGGLIGGARLLGAAELFERAALPVAGPRDRGWVHRVDADALEMLQRCRGIVQETQCDPARSELLFGLVDVLVWQRGVARD